VGADVRKRPRSLMAAKISAPRRFNRTVNRARATRCKRNGG
jgi:hypothetical protein